MNVGALRTNQPTSRIARRLHYCPPTLSYASGTAIYSIKRERKKTLVRASIATTYSPRERKSGSASPSGWSTREGVARCERYLGDGEGGLRQLAEPRVTHPNAIPPTSSLSEKPSDSASSGFIVRSPFRTTITTSYWLG